MQDNSAQEQARETSLQNEPGIVTVDLLSDSPNKGVLSPAGNPPQNETIDYLTSPKIKGKKKIDFHATGGSSQNLGISMVSAVSEESPGDRKASLKSKKQSSNNKEDDDFERDETPAAQSKYYVPEVQLPSKLYKDLLTKFPPEPLLPKSFHAKDDSPRSGGVFKFMKLAKFRGMDHGRSKFREEASKIEKINFPDGITMKKIFKVIPREDGHGQQTPADDEQQQNQQQKQQKKEPQMTPFGELVYLRSNQSDYLAKQKSFVADQRDEVLDENLVDVRNLLKNATTSQAANGKQPGQKALVNLQGIEPYYVKKDRFDKTLVFESRFESGNLAAALRVNENDYYLALQNDVNTSGNTQWFFFRVSNTRAYASVRFSLLNLCKPDSLYNEGMKVLIYSEKHAREKDVGWHRGGTKTAYYANGIRKDGTRGFRTLYTMTFTYEFEYDDDNVYFAYCYPYTYSELAEELNAIMADPIKQQYVQKKTLTETLAGNKCEVLTITSKQNPENMQKRKGVILTARVHPGESVGSWMMKGALDFLVDPNSAEAEYLRQNFVFKVVPMLNPDGVINGNYRCSLAGCDLNRRWKRPSKVLHPTIFATKQLCHQFAKERELQIFCDFHGHSRRKNIFMYGCNVPGQPEETRLFPFIMSQICPFFVYSYSRFGNQKSKESTARMALFNELKCPAIYTIESSFCGNDMGPYKNYHFSTSNLMQTGRDFCRTLMLYLPIQVPRSIVSNFAQNILDLYHHYKIISDSKLKPDPEVENMCYYFERLDKVRNAGKETQSKHLRKGLAAVLRQTADIFAENHSSSSAGSDMAPSEDNLDLEEIQKVLPVQEDPDLANKIKRSKTLKKEEEKKEQEALPALKSEGFGLRKLNTFNASTRRKGPKGPPGGGASSKSHKSEKGEKKPKINLTLQGAKIEEELEEGNHADDEGGGAKTPNKDRTPKESDQQKEEEKDQVMELKDPETGNVIHKKRRRKNVESRDVSTQTDRSDYVLIKQRQQEKQKQLMALLALKNSQDSTSAEPGVLAALAPAAAQAQGTSDSRLNLEQPRKNELTGTQSIQQRDGNVSQKVLEDYLHQQKQGLVENIMSQYNNQQLPQGAGNPKDANFSSYWLRTQQNAGGPVDLAGERVSPDPSQVGANRVQAQAQNYGAIAGSPSKKHRQLVQGREGAKQMQLATDGGVKQAAGPPPSANGGRRVLVSSGAPNRAQGKPRAGESLTGAYSHSNLASQKGQPQPTHWQKVSTNNQELTKLFYQLPGGTKSLVQNAIQSQNAAQKIYSSNSSKNRKVNQEKKLATPEASAAKANARGGLPGIQHQQNPKTPLQGSRPNMKDLIYGGQGAATSFGQKRQNLFDPESRAGQPSVQHSMATDASALIQAETPMKGPVPLSDPRARVSTTAKKPPLKGRISNYNQGQNKRLAATQEKQPPSSAGLYRGALPANNNFDSRIGSVPAQSANQLRMSDGRESNQNQSAASGNFSNAYVVQALSSSQHINGDLREIEEPGEARQRQAVPARASQGFVPPGMQQPGNHSQINVYHGLPQQKPQMGEASRNQKARIQTAGQGRQGSKIKGQYLQGGQQRSSTKGVNRSQPNNRMMLGGNAAGKQGYRNATTTNSRHQQEQPVTHIVNVHNQYNIQNYFGNVYFGVGKNEEHMMQ